MRTNESKSLFQDESPQLDLPGWKTLIRKLAKEYSRVENLPEAKLLSASNQHIALIDELRKIIKQKGQGFHPAIAYELLSHACSSAKGSYSLDDTLEIIRKIPLPSNTFYSIYDTELRELVGTDPRVMDILGISPEDFTFGALLGLVTEHPLFHPEDLRHSIRMGSIAYLVLSIPGLEIRALEDYFRLRYRIGVTSSKFQYLRDIKYVTIEKSAFMIRERMFNDPLPTQFLYKISVFTDDDFQGMQPYFVSYPNRSIYMNAFHYLFHAQLLGINTKFLLLLDERSRLDRNKVIANSLNQKLSGQGNVVEYFDEGQVADCFAKTIRTKISEAINTWENRQTKLTIASDQEAVHYAKTLGLLPVPTKVLDLIYTNALPN